MSCAESVLWREGWSKQMLCLTDLRIKIINASCESITLSMTSQWSTPDPYLYMLCYAGYWQPKDCVFLRQWDTCKQDQSVWGEKERRYIFRLPSAAACVSENAIENSLLEMLKGYLLFYHECMQCRSWSFAVALQKKTLRGRKYATGNLRSTQIAWPRRRLFCDAASSSRVTNCLTAAVSKSFARLETYVWARRMNR